MEPLVVLIVDANRIFLQSISRFLTEHTPIQLVIGSTSSDMAEALELAPSLRPDIVLLGLANNAQATLRLLPQLRDTLPQAGILVLGVFEANGYEQAARAAGADAFLLKDDLPTALLPTIIAVMRGRRTD